MTELRPYPAYRDSGVEWLGEVPEHWKVRRLKYAVSFTGGGTPSKANPSFWSGPIPWVSPKDMTRTHLNDTADHISDDAVASSAARIVAPGAVLVVVRSGILRRMIPVAMNTVPVALNQDLKALRPRNGIVRSEYLHALIQGNQSLLLREWTKHGATVESIEHRLLANSRIPIPPLPEQTAVARFLDDADRRIQRYIRAKERLIGLLEEQKQAVILQAVTGQIDVRTGRPYPSYKDSGPEWLGSVPEHWQLCPLHRCVTILGGMTPSMDNRRFWDGGIPWVTPKDMKKDVINNSRLKVTDAALKHTSLKEVDPGAVLIVVRGMILARTVPVAWTTVPVTINQDMKALTPCPRVNAEFLGNQLGAAQQALLSGVDVAGHGTRRLPTEHWRALPVAIPPQDEQQHIVDAVRDANRIATKATARTQALIECAKEYHTRLIADVVTGKLDVRDAAAKLAEADSIAGGNRVDTIQTESHPFATEHDMAKEAIP